MTLQVSDNPLSFPPAAVISEGTRAILGFLRNHLVSQSCQSSLPGSCHENATTTTTIVYRFGDVEGHRERINGSGAYCDESDVGSYDDVDDEGDVDVGGREGSEDDDMEGSDRGDEVVCCDGDVGDGTIVCGDGGEAACVVGVDGADGGRVWRTLERNNTRESEGSFQSTSPTHRSAGLRVAIRSYGDHHHNHHHYMHHNNTLEVDEEEYRKSEQLRLLPPPDSERDTLGRPHTPISPCLLTPNADFPSRPEYDLGHLNNPRILLGYHYDPRNDSINTITPTSSSYHQSTSPSNARDRTRCRKNSDFDHLHHRQLDPLEDDPRGTSGNTNNTNNNDAKTQDGSRRSLHLRLQDEGEGDDLESLEGDLGEGYRRPHSRLEDNDAEGNKDVSWKFRRELE